MKNKYNNNMKGLEDNRTLKELLLDVVSKHPRSYLQKLKLYDDYDCILAQIIECTSKLTNPNISLKTRVYWIINDIYDFPRCSNPKCNRLLDDKNIKNIIVGYPTHCCPQCAKDSPLRKQRYANNFRNKYGVNNPSQLEAVKLKKIDTCVSHFGVENPAQSDEVKRKISSTNIARYGSSCAMNSDSIKRNTMRRNLLKYGCEHYSQTMEFIDKVKLTNNAKYGVDFPQQDPEFRRNAQKKYKYDGLNFDSAPEIALYIYCKDHKIDVEYQPNISFRYEFESKWYSYQPDFRINGKLYEIKGLHFFENRDPTAKMINPFDRSFDGLYEHKHQCMVKNNIIIITNYDKYLKYVNDTYGKQYLNSFKSDTHDLLLAAEAAFSKFGRSSFEQFQKMDFPYIEIDKDKVEYELEKLASCQQSDTHPSYIIRSFHKSRYNCNKEHMLSPIVFWDEFKNEQTYSNGVWQKFFTNRYMHCTLKDIKQFRETGKLTPNIILSGFNAMKLNNTVSYLKPALAKRLVNTYLDGYQTVFCPFNGFSGIMLGSVVGAGRNFVGQDINANFINESRRIQEIIDPNHVHTTLKVQDIFSDSGEYDCLFACPPYNKIEQWNFADGKNIDVDLTCDQWIDECLSRYKCQTYLFVVDDKSTLKYKKNVIETLCNRSHFGKNYEYIVRIGK